MPGRARPSPCCPASMPTSRGNSTPSQLRPPTRDLLISSAGEAFNTAGFLGTDTNKIARAAGFAPQTFYRHFTDKVDVFLAVYEQWQQSEREALTRASQAAVALRAIATALLQHHQEWAPFRRSLRWLAVEDERVRRARAAGRERQLDMLAQLPDNLGRSRAQLLAALLKVERLCDAAADGELVDMGVTTDEVIELVIAAVSDARGSNR